MVIRRIYWDRGGRSPGREARYIYVEWEGGGRLLIDIRAYADDYIERRVIPRLPEYLRTVPPLLPLELRSCEGEFLTFDTTRGAACVEVKYPYSLVDCTPYWRATPTARLQSTLYGCWYLLSPLDDPAAVGCVAVPRAVAERWQLLKRALDELLPSIL